MKLSHFSTLAASFAAGLALCGCAAPMGQSPYAQGYANSGPAYAQVVDPATGQVVGVVPAGAQGVYQSNPRPGYAIPYEPAQPRYPYGYAAPQGGPNYSALGMVGGGVAGSALSHGNAAAIAAGAIAGRALGASSDPCATPLNEGTVVGGAVGYAAGSQIGKGTGRKVAQVALALFGSAQGQEIAAQGRPRAPGCR